ncbi:MAG: hypothetical protein WCC27_20105 [Acidobacteriaceae bacterium]
MAILPQFEEVQKQLGLLIDDPKRLGLGKRISPRLVSAAISMRHKVRDGMRELKRAQSEPDLAEEKTQIAAPLSEVLRTDRTCEGFFNQESRRMLS